MSETLKMNDPEKKRRVAQLIRETQRTLVAVADIAERNDMLNVARELRQLSNRWVADFGPPPRRGPKKGRPRKQQPAGEARHE